VYVAPGVSPVTVVKGSPLVDGVLSPSQCGHAGEETTWSMIGSPPSYARFQLSLTRLPDLVA
jgi:hypothetical protein